MAIEIKIPNDDNSKDATALLGNEEENFWHAIIKETENSIEGLKNALKYKEACLEMAKSKYKEAGKN